MKTINIEDESPYCDVCGTCGYIGCCGIRNFISEHIQGKTNCKNEDLIISELIDLCDYKDKVFEENDKLKQQLKEKDKEIERLSKEVDMWNRKYNEQIDIINELEKYLYGRYQEWKDSENELIVEGALEDFKILQFIRKLKEGSDKE